MLVEQHKVRWLIYLNALRFWVKMWC